MIKVYYIELSKSKYHLGLCNGDIEENLSHIQSSYPNARLIEQIEFKSMAKARNFRKSVVALFADATKIEFIGGKATQIFTSDVLDLTCTNKQFNPVFKKVAIKKFRDRIKGLTTQKAK